ncbi:MAG: hypothetical protein IJ264_08845 [Clostridia bacterium]|nr:hypothetical protein [Clostridia bacterium]
MKKILSIILSVALLTLCLCSCSRGFAYGIYEGELNEATKTKPYLMINNSGNAGFSYNHTNQSTYRATAEVDEENKKVTVDFTSTDTVFVFEIQGDSLVFIADESSAPEEFNGIPGLADGQKLTASITFAESKS